MKRILRNIFEIFSRDKKRWNLICFKVDGEGCLRKQKNKLNDGKMR